MSMWRCRRNYDLNGPAEAIREWISLLEEGGFSIRAKMPMKVHGHDVFLSGIVQRSDGSHGKARVRFTVFPPNNCEQGRCKVVISGGSVAGSIARILLSCGFLHDDDLTAVACLSLFRCNLNKDIEDFFVGRNLVVFPDCHNCVTLRFTKPYVEANWRLYVEKPSLRVGVGHTSGYGSYFAVCDNATTPDEWRRTSLYKAIIDEKDRYHLAEVVLVEP